MKKVTVFLFLINLSLLVAAQHCKGTNKSGKPCGITVGLNKDSLCRWHDTTLQCGATRSDGFKCRMPVDKPGQHCRYHPDSRVLFDKHRPRPVIAKNK